MSVTFRPAVRENVPLLLGLAGGTGSGKTYSALQLATGMAQGQKFVVLDTENGRAKHYADTFSFDVADLVAPFRPDTYADVIKTADAAGYPVIVVDSMSHEWAGDGGCLDWQEEIMGGDRSKSPVAWATVKRAHKKMMSQLLQVNAHVVLCFRAEPKVDIVKNDKGRMQFVPKKSVTGLDGWLPITEKMVPYELTASFLLMADAPGIPRPIKLEEQHKPFFGHGQPLTAAMGAELAKWAAGGKTSKRGESISSEPPAATVEAITDSPPPLTTSQLRHKCASAFIAPDQAAAAVRRMFPGREAKSLTDEERGALFADMVAAKEAQQVMA